MQKTVCLMEGHWDSCIKDIAFLVQGAGLKNAVFVETITL